MGIDRNQQSADDSEAQGRWLIARTNLLGYRFKEDVLSDAVLSQLQPSSVLNGAFFHETLPDVRVYLSSWTSSSVTKLASMLHNPDWCWTEVGWRSIELGQPERFDVDIAGQNLTFECRVFRSAQGNHLELVAWCTLIDGQVLQEHFSPMSEYDPLLRAYLRRGAKANWSFTLQHLTKRKTVRSKGIRQQIVRVSVPVVHDWESGYRYLLVFIPQWLSFPLNNSNAVQYPATQPLLVE